MVDSDQERSDGTGRKRRIWLLIAAIVRSFGSAALLVVIYYTLPLNGRLAETPLFVILVTTAALACMVAYQLRSIMNADYPLIRGIEALFTLVPLLLLTYSAVYCAMSQANHASFNEILTRTDGIYFTVTVFATVGFGDIHAVTQAARLVVTSQMLIDLLILGVGLRVFMGAIRRGRQRQAAPK